MHKNPINIFTFALIAAALICLSGCSGLISATSDGPVNGDAGERTWGAAIDDEQIETLALVNLGKASRALEEAHINVTSFNGVVLLSGEVSSNEVRALAGKTVGKINRVRQVYNELQVHDKTSFFSRTHDSWLTSKVKSKLLANGDIDSGRIKVVTEDNTVFMMGLLTSAEADQAVKVVRDTDGVQKIVKVFEYID
jgi:osmotically-inducible protein OsmY